MAVKTYTVPAELPSICAYAAEKLALELRDREQTRRVPDATAKVLVLMVKLYEIGAAFPPRDRLAAHTGVSVQTIDVVLSQRQATRDIRIIHLAMKGSKQSRMATMRGRRVIPSLWLRKLVADAEAEYKKMQRNMRPPAVEPEDANNGVTA